MGTLEARVSAYPWHHGAARQRIAKTFSAGELSASTVRLDFRAFAVVGMKGFRLCVPA